MAKKARKVVAGAAATKKAKGAKKSPPAKYPRHSVEKVLRIPRAILEQNAGKSCTVKEAAKFVGIGSGGPFQVEISSGIKYGFLDRPTPGQVSVTDRAKRVLRPQSPQDRIDGLREAINDAPVVSEVYKHYRGENLPDAQFFNNALVDTFGIPADKIEEFSDVFISSLEAAELLTEHDGKRRVLDIAGGGGAGTLPSPTLKKLEKGVRVDADDTCFVMMPFAEPLGLHFEQIYKPAIEKAGLRPMRADADIFGTGKIIEQIWNGINSARILLAELTSRNPNVFYELGLAHALEKPVVLVSANDQDVPFDLQHIRVIYYDVNDPFWGNKLINKVAENILSAIQHPEEAVLKRKP